MAALAACLVPACRGVLQAQPRVERSRIMLLAAVALGPLLCRAVRCARLRVLCQHAVRALRRATPARVGACRKAASGQRADEWPRPPPRSSPASRSPVASPRSTTRSRGPRRAMVAATAPRPTVDRPPVRSLVAGHESPRVPARGQRPGPSAQRRGPELLVRAHTTLRPSATRRPPPPTFASGDGDPSSSTPQPTGCPCDRAPTCPGCASVARVRRTSGHGALRRGARGRLHARAPSLAWTGRTTAQRDSDSSRLR